MPPEPLPTLLLAGRRGPADPVAVAAGLTHRVLVPIAGVSMIVRVVRALMASRDVGGVRVSTDDAAALGGVPELAAALRAGTLTLHASRESPAASVLDALKTSAPGTRMLVTTADHPLLTPEILDYFVAQARARDADVAVGLVAASVVRAAHPGSPRTFVRLRDEAWTGANLFLLRAPGAAAAAAFWRRVELDRKRPWRLVRHFGIATLVRFALGRLDLEAALTRVSKVVDARVVAVPLPFAEAAIDVDRPADLELATRLIEARERAAAAPGTRHASV